VPTPGLEDTHIAPPCSSTKRLLMVNPRPLPPTRRLSALSV
jgi:hypothetical protein